MKTETDKKKALDCKFGPVAFLFDKARPDIIEIEFLRTDTSGIIHKKDVPYLIGVLKNLDLHDKPHERPCLDLSSSVCGSDKNA